MIKKVIVGVLITIIVITTSAVYLFFNMQHGGPKEWGIKPETIPEVINDQELAKHNSELERIWGFCSQDLSAKHMSQVSLQFISHIAFDQNTKWPNEDKLPKGFNSDLWLQIGKDPGLNISKIHEKGITGKGVTVAVIDKPIVSTHIEFKDRITYSQVGVPQTNPHFHGMACASILAGKTCGVAPDAKLYYFAVPDLPDRQARYMKAIETILDINKSLPEKEKIRIVSISDGVEQNNKNWVKWQETLTKAQSEGLIVVYSNLLGADKFLWGGCDPSKDRNNPSNYLLSDYFDGKNIDKSMIIIPGDYRTTASNDGNNQYVYWGHGGFSWAIPYVAGLAALAWQVNPNMTFDQIINKLIETKAVTSEGRYIINPESFIDSISKG